MLLRIDDTDPARNIAGGEEAILGDLGWLGIDWDEGPARQSERQDRYREAAERIGTDRFDGVTLLREDGTATYHLASVVDDADFGITHVYRGNDHRPNEDIHRRLHEALGTTPPEYVHHGLILGEDGKKLSKRAAGATVASLRELGFPAGAVRTYLDELGVPRHDVHYDLARLRRLAVEASGRCLDDEELRPPTRRPRPSCLARRPRPRTRRGRSRARCWRRLLRSRASIPETLVRFHELRDGAPETLDQTAAKEILRELKAVGGNLKALRRALTGADRGPELWAVLVALPRAEALLRADAASS